MKKLIFLFFLSPAFSLQAQKFKLKSADELINYADPGWKSLRAMIDSATNKVSILSVDTAQGRDAVYQMQIGTNMQLGTLMYMTGGLLIEDGWIRILGSGSNKLPRSIPNWNKGKTVFEQGERPPYLFIADDAMGGFFVLNFGGLGNDGRKVYYLCPWTLQWQALGWDYNEFLQFCFEGDLEEFYKPYMSKNWKFDVQLLPSDKCYSYVPPLWAKEGKNFTKSVRKYLPVEEQYNYNMEMRKKFGLEDEDK